ncbi:hypothetical protein CJF31_00011218 [Rutstroemia sp. NJR-2017a BVV2]|nr:hypothetical protein CJF31_00011218 [Rutstroemia sp. NJR-2017a BVV2]
MDRRTLRVFTYHSAKREKTPEDRSTYDPSGNPANSIPLFNVGDSVWLKIVRVGNFELTVAERRKQDGKYQYQLKDADGKLYEAGEWVNQERLNASG